MKTVNKKEVKTLIKLYEKVLHGSEKKMGLFSCYDTYYAGCWDNELANIEYFKKILKLK